MFGATARPEANFNLHRSRLSAQCLLLISELLIGEGLELNKWKRGRLGGIQEGHEGLERALIPPRQQSQCYTNKRDNTHLLPS